MEKIKNYNNIQEQVEDMDNIKKEIELNERRIRKLEMLDRNKQELDKLINKLKQSIRRKINYDTVILIYICSVQVSRSNQALNQGISDWEDILDQDDQGEAALPIDGEPGYCYNPDSSSLAERRFKIDSGKHEAKLLLSRYYMGLTKAEQLALRDKVSVPH